MARREDIDQFYRIIDVLERRIGGKHFLADCTGRNPWPKRGVYFFFEDGEFRENGDMRVVRVGTHALIANTRTTLWARLRQHKGTARGQHPGGGDHRGSVFRLHVGTAIISREALDVPTWSVGSTASSEIKNQEAPIERLVSEYIRSMPFLWVGVNGPPGPNSKRLLIEKNAIALLSNYGRKVKVDSTSLNWLGKYAWSDKIKISGLWNVDYVDQDYDQDFLNLLKRCVDEMK